MGTDRLAVTSYVNLPNPGTLPFVQEFKDRSKPLFMIFRKGAKLQIIEGVNTYALKVLPPVPHMHALTQMGRGREEIHRPAHPRR